MARKVRTLFISDVHLGTPGCQAAQLLAFLRAHECEQLYLVGDIIDGWRLRSKWRWPGEHDAVAAHVLSMAGSGVKVTYVIGNHDDFLREAPIPTFAGLEVSDAAIHETADGERYLVIHGDQFDAVTTNARWLSRIGDAGYGVLLAANTAFNRWFEALGLPYWSLSAWVKHRFKKAVNFISDYESRVAEEARRNNLRGIICGHIHHAAISDERGVRYINTGDWVESCTAVAELDDGTFELIRWADRHPVTRRQVGVTVTRHLGHLAARGLSAQYAAIRRGLRRIPEAVRQRLAE